jgi:hypothetical protein
MPTGGANRGEQPTVTLMARAAGAWLIMVPAAVLNGLARDNTLAPLFGKTVALPLSGATLSALIFAIAWFTIPRLGLRQKSACWLVGLLWAALTLAFEYGFGHYVAERPWREINRLFDVTEGNLLILVVAVLLTAPRITAGLRKTV